MEEPKLALERRLTHVELLHRPGERQLARRFFELLGCETVDSGGHWFTSLIQPSAERDFSNNVFYTSEVGEEQWALERAIADSAAVAHYRSSLRRGPQKTAHFGFRVPTEANLVEIVERVRAAEQSDQNLTGRIAVDAVYRPGDPNAVAPNMIQAFVWSDIVAAGLFSLGQYIEIQWHLS